MNDKMIMGGSLVLVSGGLYLVASFYPDLAVYVLAAILLCVAVLGVAYLRLPLLVEARCNDEKLVVVSRAGVERVVLLKDIARVYSNSLGSEGVMDDHDPWLEYGVATVRHSGKADEVLRFRMQPSGGNLGTHPAIAKLMRRVQRLQDKEKQ